MPQEVLVVFKFTCPVCSRLGGCECQSEEDCGIVRCANSVAQLQKLAAVGVTGKWQSKGSTEVGRRHESAPGGLSNVTAQKGRNRISF